MDDDERKQRDHLNAATDDALKAATEALGTPRFPLLLIQYHRAMERASASRLDRRSRGIGPDDAGPGPAA